MCLAGLYPGHGVRYVTIVLGETFWRRRLPFSCGRSSFQTLFGVCKVRLSAIFCGILWQCATHREQGTPPPPLVLP